MARRPLSVGELAVHFGMEPIEVEWLMRNYATGMTRPELMREIQRLGCTDLEAERLAEHIYQSVVSHHARVIGQPRAGPRQS
jgi:hypothetical protein